MKRTQNPKDTTRLLLMLALAVALSIAAAAVWGGAVRELAAGDFCLVRQGQRFWYENAAEEPATLLLVHTPPYDPDAEVFVEDG